MPPKKKLKSAEKCEVAEQILPMNIKPHMICKFCHQSKTEETEYSGHLYKLTRSKKDEYYHFFCLLFSSNGHQSGNAEQGVEGFLPEEIDKEFKRGEKLICHICKKKGATIRCRAPRCTKKYHFPCGFRREEESDDYFFIFQHDMKSFCSNHGPKQDRRKFQKQKSFSEECPICQEDFEDSSFPAPGKIGCHVCSSVFHRRCLQGFAATSGIHHFKCPMCKSDKEFLAEVLRMGIHVPEQDAVWEKPENSSFYGFDQGPQKECIGVGNCKCEMGSLFNKLNTPYEIINCTSCGYNGVHISCGGLDSSRIDYMCSDCKPPSDDPAASESDVDSDASSDPESNARIMEILERRKMAAKAAAAKKRSRRSRSSSASSDEVQALIDSDSDDKKSGLPDKSKERLEVARCTDTKDNSDENESRSEIKGTPLYFRYPDGTRSRVILRDDLNKQLGKMTSTLASPLTSAAKPAPSSTVTSDTQRPSARYESNASPTSSQSDIVNKSDGNTPARRLFKAASCSSSKPRATVSMSTTKSSAAAASKLGCCQRSGKSAVSSASQSISIGAASRTPMSGASVSLSTTGVSATASPNVAGFKYSAETLVASGSQDISAGAISNPPIIHASVSRNQSKSSTATDTKSDCFKKFAETSSQPQSMSNGLVAKPLIVGAAVRMAMANYSAATDTDIGCLEKSEVTSAMVSSGSRGICNAAAFRPPEVEGGIKTSICDKPASSASTSYTAGGVQPLSSSSSSMLTKSDESMCQTDPLGLVYEEDDNISDLLDSCDEEPGDIETPKSRPETPKSHSETPKLPPEAPKLPPEAPVSPPRTQKSGWDEIFDTLETDLEKSDAEEVITLDSDGEEEKLSQSPLKLMITDVRSVAQDEDPDDQLGAEAPSQVILSEDNQTDRHTKEGDATGVSGSLPGTSAADKTEEGQKIEPGGSGAKPAEKGYNKPLHQLIKEILENESDDNDLDYNDLDELPSAALAAPKQLPESNKSDPPPPPPDPDDECIILDDDEPEFIVID